MNFTYQPKKKEKLCKIGLVKHMFINETIKFQTPSNQAEKEPDVNVECEESDSKVLHGSYIVTCSNTGYSWLVPIATSVPEFPQATISQHALHD